MTLTVAVFGLYNYQTLQDGVELQKQNFSLETTVLARRSLKAI